jgi:hypothetical protein
MKIRMIAPIAVALATAACATDGTGPRSLTTKQVGLHFGVLSPAVGNSAAQPATLDSTGSADTLVITRGSDTMRIAKVLLTIEEIELERNGQSASCNGDSTAFSDSTVLSRRTRDGVAARRGRGRDDRDDDSRDSSRSRSRSDDCEDIGGPLLIDLNLDGKGTSQINVPAVLGVYDTLQLDFDVADESSQAHANFRAAHPEMANASARIIGTFNGVPFDLKLDSRLKYEVALTMPLVVSDGSTGFELGIRIDVGSWLTRPTGSLINPLTLCSLGSRCVDREIIEENMDNARVRADGRRRGR